MSHRDDTSPEGWIISETATSLCLREVQQLWCCGAHQLTETASETPPCWHSYITFHYFSQFQGLCISFILQECSKVSQLKSCSLLAGTNSMTGYWRICFIKNNVNCYISSVIFLFSWIESIDNNKKKILKFKCILMFMPVSACKTVV